MNERERLIRSLARMGYPEQFAAELIKLLQTDYTIHRLNGYLYQAKNPSIEDIVDEALAILEDRDRIIRKKKSEYYNSRINEYMLQHDIEDDPDQNDPS
ncbi:hypothetical protein [Galactobacillus timonensis]|uniref:hypothetical protein n=1 Tax=Galactobacillus timonensis TaxID=2041840 RepID=UPI000C83F89C|nr:hypothetical protein [Galactobacillus timonensis]